MRSVFLYELYTLSNAIAFAISRQIIIKRHSIQFEKSRSDVIEAFYEANRYFHGRGVITFNEFLECLGLDHVEEGDNRGWEAYIGEAVYGYTWIDFGLKECEDEPSRRDFSTALAARSAGAACGKVPAGLDIAPLQPSVTMIIPG